LPLAIVVLAAVTEVVTSAITALLLSSEAVTLGNVCWILFKDTNILSSLIFRSTANLAGKNAIMINISNPTPFCPSLLPWKKLTSVHVVISNSRIRIGGRSSAPVGAWKRIGALTTCRRKYISNIAAPKPNTGDNTSDNPISPALSQFTWPV